MVIIYQNFYTCMIKFENHPFGCLNAYFNIYFPQSFNGFKIHERLLLNQGRFCDYNLHVCI
jgi:hypothetical protein